MRSPAPGYQLLCRSLLLASISWTFSFFPDQRRATENQLPPHHQLARDIFKELIEINTTHAHGSTRAAEAMGTRMKAAGFPAPDVQVLEPRAGKGNLVVRWTGRTTARPI